MNPSVYIETTIPSYLVARPSRDVVLAGHQEATREFWTQRKHQFDLYISALVTAEAGSGEPEMAAKRLECLQGLKILNSTDESDALALLLVARLGLPKKLKLTPITSPSLQFIRWISYSLGIASTSIICTCSAGLRRPVERLVLCLRSSARLMSSFRIRTS